MSSNGFKSPGQMRSTLAAVRAQAAFLASQALKLSKEYEESYDAGIRSLRSGTGAMGGGGKARGSHGDPTADSAEAYDYRRLRSCSGYVWRRTDASRRKLESAIIEMTSALEALHGAWLDTDPDLRQDRRAQRESAREVAKGSTP